VIQQHEAAERFYGTLDARGRAICYLYFEMGHTQDVIAEVMRVSQQRIDKLVKRYKNNAGGCVE
jgi:DNA-directed RNA polymerase specialized sigma subunit